MDNEKNLDRARTDHNHNARMEKKVYSESKKGAQKNLAMQTKNWISQTSTTVKSFKS